MAKKTVETLISYYEHEAQSIEVRMPELEKWGQGAYNRHRLMMYKQFISQLRAVKEAAENEKKND